MWNIGKPQQSAQSAGVIKKILIHLVLLLAFWSLLMFVVIPWNSGGQYPDDSFALIEGERAYAAIVREKRPNLVTTLRGLNMVHAQYVQEQIDDERCVSVGNIRIFFALDGSFKSLRILSR